MAIKAILNTLPPHFLSVTHLYGSLAMFNQSHAFTDDKSRSHGKNPISLLDDEIEEIAPGQINTRYPLDLPSSLASYEEIASFTFTSEQQGYEWFNLYAKNIGFSIRKDIVHRDIETRAVNFRRFLCSRHGYRERKHMERTDFLRGPRPLSRTGCPVFLEIQYNYSIGLWNVHRFDLDHNHELAKIDEIPFLCSQRKIEKGTKHIIDDLMMAGSRKCKIRDYIDVKNGGYENVGFILRDLYNATDRDHRKLIESGDAMAVIEAMKQYRGSDPDFFHDYLTDSYGHLKNLFWADGQSLSDYLVFGEVVIFDSTYRTNRYGMPFVPFVGVNHHRRTMLFGCGIISDETVASFVWLLETFLKAHRYKVPISIVTDGDNAMRRAIKRVLPETNHRLCAWHLARNIYSNIHDRSLVDELITIIFKKCSCDEFEHEWHDIIAKYSVTDNQWMHDHYQRRELWAEAYLQDYLFLGIRSTQRSESMNSTFRGYLARSMSLLKMVQHYSRCVARIRFNEASDDFKASQTEPFTHAHFTHLLRHAAKTYTESVFKIVQHEIEKISDYLIIDAQNDSSRTIRYEVSKREHLSNTYQIKYFQDDQRKVFSCSCNKLETLGIPCRHIFIVLHSLGEQEIPQSCIWGRWTKHAKLGIQSERHAGCRFESAVDIRLRELNTLGSYVFLSAAQDNDQFQRIKTMLQKEIPQEEIEKEYYCANQKNKEKDKESMIKQEPVLDPMHKRTKGAPKRRMKSFMEKHAYRCGHCSEKGHTRCNCPLVPKLNLPGEASESNIQGFEGVITTQESCHKDYC